MKLLPTLASMYSAHGSQIDVHSTVKFFSVIWILIKNPVLWLHEQI